MVSPTREDAVRIISDIHAVVFGLAVITAISGLILTPSGPPESPLTLGATETAFKKTILFFVFLLFAVPFYHGAALALAVNL